MLKRLTACALCLILSMGLCASALAAKEIAVFVDGVQVLGADAALVEGTSYVSLQHVANALQSDCVASYNGTTMTVTGEGITLSASAGVSYMVANGRYLYIEDGVQRSENDDILVPARTLALAFGSELTWDGSVHLSAEGTLIASGDSFYNADDLFLMSHIIYNESGNQPMAGRIAVGNVLLNRVASKLFPNTLHDVVYQDGQFYPERTGAMDKTPNAESIIAAKLCLDGAVVTSNAYWFNGVGKSCWASRNKDTLVVIGGHAFYG